MKVRLSRKSVNPTFVPISWHEQAICGEPLLATGFWRLASSGWRLASRLYRTKFPVLPFQGNGRVQPKARR